MGNKAKLVVICMYEIIILQTKYVQFLYIIIKIL